jgi:hypothetical protein
MARSSSVIVGDLAHPRDRPAIGVVTGVANLAGDHAARIMPFDHVQAVRTTMFFDAEQPDPACGCRLSPECRRSRQAPLR